MTFTTEQLNILSRWEEHFRTAVKADWARNPGTSALQTIKEIYAKATGDTRRVCFNCSNDILNLLKDCGRIYFKDTQEVKDRENTAKEVEVSPVAKEVAKKVKVATAKKSTKKTK